MSGIGGTTIAVDLVGYDEELLDKIVAQGCQIAMI
jgi:hypothetical protein